MINNAIGKWISTTCCACFAKSTVFMSNGCKVAPHSLHDDFAGHLRMNGTEVRISSWFAEGEGELFVRVEHFGLERFRIIRADYRVRDIVTVGPRNRGSSRHRQRYRREAKVVDLHFHRRRVLLRSCYRTLATCAEKAHSQHH